MADPLQYHERDTVLAAWVAEQGRGFLCTTER
jgi:hypothetical protein